MFPRNPYKRFEAVHLEPTAKREKPPIAEDRQEVPEAVTSEDERARTPTWTPMTIEELKELVDLSKERPDEDVVCSLCGRMFRAPRGRFACPQCEEKRERKEALERADEKRRKDAELPGWLAVLALLGALWLVSVLGGWPVGG